MSTSSRLPLLSFASSLCLLALAGCSGISTTFPDTAPEVHPGAISGRVMGGFSPIVGAEVYVLQAATSGYGASSTSEITSGAAFGTDSRGSYVLTDSSGGFALGGDYSCTVGEPVFLVAVGGTTNVGAYLIHITGSSTNGSTITFTGNNSLANGSSVSFASGAFSSTSGYSSLNGTTQSVTGTPTSTSFSIKHTPTISATGATGYALAGGSPNPVIQNMVVAGNCPSASGFTNLKFVYINEVSTVAAAYALNGFGTGPFNVGAPSSNLPGIASAALTAGQLFGVQTGGGGLQTTASGGGAAPYKTVNTLGNLLAACVNSNNTATVPTDTGSPCYILFANAVGTGTTAAPDTGTAMFNIAAAPGKNVSNLYSLQNAGGIIYSPSLSGTAPNDFALTISYPGGGIGTTAGTSPHSVAVDASGNIYSVSSSNNTLSIFSPLGVPSMANGITTKLNQPASVALNINSAQAAVANNNVATLGLFTISGTNATSASNPNSYATAGDAEYDGSGHIWVADTGNNTLLELTSSGSLDNYTGTDVYGPQSLSIQPGTAGTIWLANQTINNNKYYATSATNSIGTVRQYSVGGINAPVGTAIDSNSNVWFTNGNGTVTVLSSGGSAVASSPYSAGSSALDGIAIDGLNSAWVTSSVGGKLYEFTNTGTTPTITLASPTGYTATTPDGIAVDGSGNVWYNSTGSAALYEVVGAAAPVVTPISKAVANSTLGKQP